MLMAASWSKANTTRERARRPAEVRLRCARRAIPCRILAPPGPTAMRFPSLPALAAAAAMTAAGCSPTAPPATGVPDVVDFNFHVRPILSDRCFKCHGPDDRTRKAGLRFDTRDGLFTRLPSGHTPVVPGSTRRSELVRRVLSTDPAVM